MNLISYFDYKTSVKIKALRFKVISNLNENWNQFNEEKIRVFVNVSSITTHALCM